MQVLFERLLVAVIGAIAIIIVMIIFGVSIGYREEIERRNLDTYVKVTIIPLFILATIYLYMTEQLSSDIFFLALIWLFTIILCTDWTKLRRNRISESA